MGLFAQIRDNVPPTVVRGVSVQILMNAKGIRIVYQDIIRGNPVAGIRSCKMLLAHGSVCTDKGQCASDRCSWGICADPDECRADGDCDEKAYFCGDPISGKRTCKTMQSKGQSLHTCGTM